MLVCKLDHQLLRVTTETKCPLCRLFKQARTPPPFGTKEGSDLRHSLWAVHESGVRDGILSTTPSSLSCGTTISFSHLP